MRTPSRLLDTAFALARVDFEPRPRPTHARRIAMATMLALVGSLTADAVLVHIGTALFPTTRGYGHFQFVDYAKLTVIGVLIACAGWPVVSGISWAPHWLFTRLAIATTLLLFVPDTWLLLRGQPPHTVAILIAMHLAIAVVTFTTLTRGAPARNSQPAAAVRSPRTASIV